MPGRATPGGADEAGYTGQARRRTQPKHLTCDKYRDTGTQTCKPQLSQPAPGSVLSAGRFFPAWI